MRIIVTGASGFLGQNVVSRLRADGYEVVPVARRVINVHGAVRVGDYRQTPSGDMLVHLAERADRNEAEVLGARHEAESLSLLDTLLTRGWKRIVYASSGVVYGDCYETPCREDDATHGQGRYATTKLACEARVREIGGISIRLSNLYGPGQPNGTVISDIFNQIPGSGPLVLRDTRPVRDFLWIDDAAEAIVRLIDRGKADIYNVATGRGVSLGTLTQMVLSAAGEAYRPVFSSTPCGRASSIVLGIDRARSDLDWIPKVALGEGILKLLDRHTEIVRA